MEKYFKPGLRGLLFNFRLVIGQPQAAPLPFFFFLLFLQAITSHSQKDSRKRQKFPFLRIPERVYQNSIDGSYSESAIFLSLRGH